MWPFKKNNIAKVASNHGSININPEYNSGLSDKQFSTINHKLDLIMTKQEQLENAIIRLDGATNEIAKDLSNLKEQIVAGTVTEESLARLDQTIATLETLGNETITEDAPTEGNGLPA